MDTVSQPTVGIIMGSISDYSIIKDTVQILKHLGIQAKTKIVSAHRTPELMLKYGMQAEASNISVIIAAAGGAAHLPGMIAACTCVPVIGVPIKASNSIDGWDSALSILQMPNGVPVATVGINSAKNAGLLAARMIGMFNLDVRTRLKEYKDRIHQESVDSNNELPPDQG